MLVMFNEALPVLLRVTACAVLLVRSEERRVGRVGGERRTAGAVEAVPVPVRLTVCGLSLASFVMLMAPVRVPVAMGVKVTLIVQFNPAAKVAPQVLLWP